MRPDALMAGPQSRRKVKKSRWTNGEASNRWREKSRDEVCPGINGKHAKPFGKQVVVKLQELCRVVLDIHSLNGNGAKSVTGSGNSQVMQEIKEGILPLVGTSAISNEESEVTQSEMCRIPAYLRGLENDDAKRGHSSVKLEIPEAKNLKEQENDLSLEGADLCRVIKTECELDVSSVVGDTGSCKMETVDHLVDVDHKVEQKNGPIAQAVTDDIKEWENLSNQPSQNKLFSDTLNNISLHNFSRAEYHYCKERHSIEKDQINLSNQSESSQFTAADEDAGINDPDIQKLSGPHFWMGKRKIVPYSITSSSTEESLDSFVSSGLTVRESLTSFKNDNLKDDIPYNMRNCDVELGSDGDKLRYQEVSDLWSTTSSPVSGGAPPLAYMDLSATNSYRCVSHAQSWSPALLPVNSSGGIGSYLETSDILAGSLHHDVHLCQAAVPTYPSIPGSPAATVPQKGIGPETKSSKCQEGELFRRIEESLAERETLKYEEKELLKRIERSLTETKSLKCREEQLLNTIERSLTRAKSLKSQEEELLRRIEVSLSQRGSAKAEDGELLVGMETLKDTKYSFVDADSVSSMEFEPENIQDLENSLPLKKRKKWLKRATDKENEQIRIRSSPLQSFPSFLLWPMISIAELEAVGKLRQHPRLPPFPSQPMISIAELEAHTAFGKLQQQPCELPIAAPWIPRYPYCYEDNSFCGESFCSSTSVGRMYGDFFEQNGEMDGATMVYPVFKAEEPEVRYSCCKTSSGCSLSQSGVCDISYLRKVEAYSDGTALSLCSGVAEDPAVNLPSFVRPATDSLGHKANLDCRSAIDSCERTCGPSVALNMVDTDSEHVGTEVTVKDSEWTKENSEVAEVTVGFTESTKDDKMDDARNCTEVNRKIETPIESNSVKVVSDSKDCVQHCAVLYQPLTDPKHKVDVDCEAPVIVSRLTNVEGQSSDSIALLSNTVNYVVDPKCISHKGLENNTDLMGKSEEYLAYSKKAKDNGECCRKIDVPIKESKCVVDVCSREGVL